MNGNDLQSDNYIFKHIVSSQSLKGLSGTIMILMKSFNLLFDKKSFSFDISALLGLHDGNLQ